MRAAAVMDPAMQLELPIDSRSTYCDENRITCACLATCQVSKTSRDNLSHDNFTDNHEMSTQEGRHPEGKQQDLLTGMLLVARLRCATEWPGGIETTWRPPSAAAGKEQAGSPVRSGAGTGSGELDAPNSWLALLKPAAKLCFPLPGAWNRPGGVPGKMPGLEAGAPLLLVKLPAPVAEQICKVNVPDSQDDSGCLRLQRAGTGQAKMLIAPEAQEMLAAEVAVFFLQHPPGLPAAPGEKGLPAGKLLPAPAPALPCDAAALETARGGMDEGGMASGAVGPGLICIGVATGLVAVAAGGATLPNARCSSASAWLETGCGGAPVAVSTDKHRPGGLSDSNHTCRSAGTETKRHT